MKTAASPLVVLAAAVAFAVAACGGGSSPTAAPTPAQSAAPASPATGAITLTVGTAASAGKYLEGRNGLALYVFLKDTGTTSACYDACAAAWPPLLETDAAKVTAGNGVSGTLGTTVRTDGTTQVTYNGAPLYYFANDKAAGDTNGEGLQSVWYVAAPIASGGY
jgi:predicted lipoprotein with Yx(FWY)xxD motif